MKILNSKAANIIRKRSASVSNKLIALVVIAFLFAGSSAILTSQPFEVHSQSNFRFLMIGKLDNNGGMWSTNNHTLSFGKGNVNHSAGNCGLWNVSVDSMGLSFARSHNAFPNSTSSRCALFLDTNARVGVGIHLYNRPQYTLDVWGYIRSSNGVCVGSDIRYKREIAPLSSALSNLFKLQGVEYKKSGEAYREMLADFKRTEHDVSDNVEYASRVQAMENLIAERDADMRVDFGFIAQELMKVYPDLVHEDEYGYLSVNYTGMIPVLVEAIKELKVELDVLRENAFGKTSANPMVSAAKLYQNIPNPFDEQTEIKFFIPSSTVKASIKVYDMTGKELMKFEIRDRENGSLIINARQLQPGMYMYSLIVDGKEIATHRMIITGK